MNNPIQSEEEFNRLLEYSLNTYGEATIIRNPDGASFVLTPGATGISVLTLIKERINPQNNTN